MQADGHTAMLNLIDSFCSFASALKKGTYLLHFSDNDGYANKSRCNVCTLSLVLVTQSAFSFYSALFLHLGY
jgi:hypothetical protein